MASGIRLLAAVLLVLALALSWKAVSMLGASSHFGSPAMQLCSALGDPVDFAKACETFKSQVLAMSGQYSVALKLLVMAAIAAFFLGAAALNLSFRREGAPPDNSLKSKPLSGSA